MDLVRGHTRDLLERGRPVAVGGSDRRGALQEDGAQHVGTLQQLGGRPVEADLTLLHEVRGLGQREGQVHRLLDEDDRRPGLADLLHDREQLLDHGGRQTE